MGRPPRTLMMGGVRVVSAIAVALALTLIAGPVAAKGLKPDDAAEARASVQAGLPADPRLAVDALRLEAEMRGDPELFLLAAQSARDLAAQERNPEMAAVAQQLALTARDIGSYLGQDENFDATDWRPVTRERAQAISLEAGTVATQARSLIDEIEAERAADAEAARLAALEGDEEERAGMRPGTGLIAGGSAALVLGVGGVALLATGLSMGSSAQREAESLSLPAELDRLAELDSKGSTGNVLAFVGGAVAGVGVAVGVALIVVGVKKRKAAGPEPEAGLAGVRVGGWALRDSAGLTLSGNF